MNHLKLLFKTAGILAILLFAAFTGTMAQTPTYKAELRNDHQVSDKIYEFDVYLLRTGTTPFEYTNMQFGININPAAINGGTITVSLVAGTSELNASQIPTASKFSFTASKSSINMTAMPGPGAGMGTIISNTGNGTRVGTIRITNSVPFSAVRPNLTWGWNLTNVNVITKVGAYVGGIPTTITTQPTHTTNNLINGILNQAPAVYAVTGSGAYCETLPGLAVGIAGSETTVTYTLYKDGVAQTPTKVGTGAALSFGIQPNGTYTVKGKNTITLVESTMTGSAIIVKNPVAVITNATTGFTLCNNSTTSITFTSNVPSTFAWSAAVVSGTVTGASNGSGAAIAQTLVNTGNAPATVEYTVTPTANTGSCTGNAVVFTVIVNPTVSITSTNAATWISNTSNTYTITANTSAAATSYTWSRAAVSGISPATGSGATSTISETLVNATGAPINVPYIITPTAYGCTGSPFTLNVTVNPAFLNLTDLFVETLDAGNGSMKQALNGTGPQFGAGIADTITVELRDAANYNTLIYRALNVKLMTNGTATVGIPTQYKASYYITIKHRNSIVITTATSVSLLANTTTRSFGTRESVYGNNLVLKSGKYMMYTGDSNQDGIIDLDDMNQVEHRAQTLTRGYLPTDLNGDGVIDVTDMNRAETNAASMIISILPGL